MSRFASILLLLLAAGFLYLAASSNAPLREMRRQAGISQADPLINAPPLVTFTTIALGGFRGILADVLWLRAARLQEEGQYFELVQLADWITKLEPRFTSVWSYHAWNLAYNISVLFAASEDRWRWVSSGVRLLRDEGLAYNPGEPRLLYELGWLFQHKIGANLDQAHLYYKQAWAAEMAQLFDGPRPDYGALMMAATNSPDAGRYRRLKEDYKLDPALMREVEAQYGPLDWRLPQAHAIYWAWRSRLIATDFDALSADRMIFQNLSDAFRQGSLFTGPDGKEFIPSPNPDLLPRVRDAYEDALRRNPGQDTVKTAYRNFLGEAVVMLLSYNRNEEARELFDELAKTYPGEDTAQGFGPFVMNTYAASLKDLTDRNAQAVVEGSLYQAMLWQALGDPARAAGYDRLARLAWDTYMAPRKDSAEWAERTGLPPLAELRAIARQRVSETVGGLR